MEKDCGLFFVQFQSQIDIVAPKLLMLKLNTYNKKDLYCRKFLVFYLFYCQLELPSGIHWESY